MEFMLNRSCGTKIREVVFLAWEWPEIACLRAAPLPCSENPRSKMELLMLAGPTVFTAARDPRAAETIIVMECRGNTVKVHKMSGFHVFLSELQFSCHLT